VQSRAWSWHGGGVTTFSDTSADGGTALLWLARVPRVEIAGAMICGGDKVAEAGIRRRDTTRIANHAIASIAVPEGRSGTSRP